MCRQLLKSSVCVCIHLRATLHNDTTHSIHATVTHVHTLILDLHHPALEVLLVEQHDLHRGHIESRLFLYTMFIALVHVEGLKQILDLESFLDGAWKKGNFLNCNFLFQVLSTDWTY